MIDSFINRWANFVIDHRGIVILIATLFMAAAVFPMKNLYYDNSDELFFVKGDPNLKKYDLFIERFGDSEYLSIATKTKKGEKNIFTP
ncbi:hypothetical protein KKA14_12705, partial [bacterium]|nr:hypothetical protein [bacterium]